MAILTKREILERITKGNIGISPGLDEYQVQEHSIDLRLGFTFLIPKVWRLTTNGREALDVTHFDNSNAEYFDVVELEQGQYFDLLPHEHILVSTFEKVKIPDDLMAVLYPRSSTNRKGLSLDLTGIIDSGYEGQLILPIRNNTHSQIVRLFPGERICQLVFEYLTEPVTARKSKYHLKDIIDGVQKEKNDESNYIKLGKIKELKNDHKVIIT
jgi:dCTP deaminase